MRGQGLVGKVQFPLIEEGYLRDLVVGMAPVENAEWMEGVVAEALQANVARRDCFKFELELLGPKALDYRVGLRVKWGEYADGSNWRLNPHAYHVWAIMEC